jgi:hypothetical protein
MYQEVLKEMDFLQGSQFLTKLPDDICCDTLFKSIESIHLSNGKFKFDMNVSKHHDASKVC